MPVSSVTLIVGIDPGKQGAIAFMDRNGAILAIDDIPVEVIAKGKGETVRIKPVELWALLRDIGSTAHVFLERPEAFALRFRDKQTGMPQARQPGAQGMLALGENFGVIRGQCIAAGAQLTDDLSPSAWKQAMGIPYDKKTVLELARKKFPEQVKYFKRVKDADRAEACYLALYGKRKLFGW